MVHLNGGRSHCGADRFDGHVSASFGVGTSDNVDSAEPLRENGGGALGFTLEDAFGADKSEC